MIFGIAWSVKALFGIISTLLAVLAYPPYFRDIISRKTQPHAYSWLIWTITQGTATFALLYGGGGWGALGLVVGTFFVFMVFLLSLKYGTRNITFSDGVILGLAFLAVLVWWQLHQPLLAVLMVTAIDAFGFIPSLRKTFEEPWSETLWTWVVFVLSNVLGIIALQQYNFFTLTYISMLTIGNTLMVLTCFVRRRHVAKPIAENVA
jgi:hypothetical protein